MSIEGEVEHIWGLGIYGKSLCFLCIQFRFQLCVQFCCEPKTSLKKLSLLNIEDTKCLHTVYLVAYQIHFPKNHE